MSVVYSCCWPSPAQFAWVWVTLRLTVSQSVCLDDQILVTISQFLFCPWGRPLWREGGSVFCQSLSAVIRQLSVCTVIYILHVLHNMTLIYNIYKAPVSPGPVQQTTPHFRQPSLQRQSSNPNGRTPDRRQAQTSRTLRDGLRPVQWCEHPHHHDSVWPLPVARTIPLCNHTRMELESQAQIADRCAPWTIANSAEYLVL
jgi:hypothetical protein